MMPKRGELDFYMRILQDALDFLASVDQRPFVLVPYPYAHLDWKECAKIVFTDDEPPDDRSNITIFLKFILTCYLNCFY